MNDTYWDLKSKYNQLVDLIDYRAFDKRTEEQAHEETVLVLKKIINQREFLYQQCIALRRKLQLPEHVAAIFEGCK